MTTNTNNINTNDDNIIAVIDGVVYAKKPSGRPKNPLRWREDGTYFKGTFDKEKVRAYAQKYYVLKPCEFCGKELQIHNFKRHYASSTCKILRELKELKEVNEKLSKFEGVNESITT